jgi:RecB family endonuclease NucS
MTKVFNSLPLEDGEKLIQLVAEHCRALDENLQIVGQEQIGRKWGPMDLLALDAKGRPVIIDVAPQTGEQLLVRGLADVSWLYKNRHQLADLLAERQANPDLYPRLILVAPDFSAQLQEAIEGLCAMAIDLFRFRWLESGEEKGLLLESAFTSRMEEKEADAPQNSFLPLPQGLVPLAEEEIAAFLKMERPFTL